MELAARCVFLLSSFAALAALDLDAIEPGFYVETSSPSDVIDYKDPCKADLSGRRGRGLGLVLDGVQTAQLEQRLCETRGLRLRERSRNTDRGFNKALFDLIPCCTTHQEMWRCLNSFSPRLQSLSHSSARKTTSTDSSAGAAGRAQRLSYMHSW
ncbi:unnamed protein product [Leuciscus chuanchicus]